MKNQNVDSPVYSPLRIILILFVYFCCFRFRCPFSSVIHCVRLFAFFYSSAHTNPKVRRHLFVCSALVTTHIFQIIFLSSLYGSFISVRFLLLLCFNSSRLPCHESSELLFVCRNYAWISFRCNIKINKNVKEKKNQTKKAFRRMA